MPETPKSGMPGVPTTITFDYIKGSDFRVCHVDGAFMAGAPGGLTVSFYSERQPIPRRVVHRITPSPPALAEEIVEQRVVRDAVVRDVSVALAMNIDVAKSIHKALGDIINAYEEMAKAAG
jgi:hypothetical protein